MNTKINVQDELAEAKLTPYHWRLGAMMALLTLFDGYDTFNPAYVIHFVKEPWGLAAGQAGLLVSSGLVGFLIGAALHGLVADRYGRRATLLGGLWITSLFTLLTPILGNSFESFCLIRLLTGLGLGVLLPLATTYLNELAPRRVANSFVLWGVALGWAAGGAMAGVIGVFVTPHYGWESLYWIGSASFILLAALHFTLPESVRFLALRGKHEEIAVLLSRLRPDRAAAYQNAIFEADAELKSNSIGALLTPRYRRQSLTIWCTAFLSLFCLFGLSGWIPTVMIARGETFATGFSFGALMQVASFIGGLACGMMADRRGGTRGWLAGFWVCGGLSVLTLAFVNTHLVNVLGVTAAGFFIIGAQFVLNNFTAQSYDTSVRASAVGMELGVGRIGAILGPYVAGVLQQGASGATPMFLAIGVSAIAAGLVIASLPPAPGSPSTEGAPGSGRNPAPETRADHA